MADETIFDRPYQRADNGIKALNSRAVRRFNEAEHECAISGFDELTIIKTSRQLYKDLDKDNREMFLSIALLVYADMMLQLDKKAKKKNLPSKKWIEDTILDVSDPVTLYVYGKEVERKRQRLEEGVVSSIDKSEEFKRALHLWSRQSSQYCDIVTDKTLLKAYVDAGVEFVKWVTQEDEKVCKYCRPLDGKVYPIAKAPPKKHYHCRCYLVPCEKDGSPWVKK